MPQNHPLLVWAVTSILLLSVTPISSQCNAPDAFWTTFPQSASSVTLNWSPVIGAQYQLRYWRTISPDDKTIVDNFLPGPSLLKGLKKYTDYTFEIRAKCGNTTSPWSAAINFSTPYTTGSCSAPTGAAVTTTATGFNVSWTSGGGHTIRYRIGTAGDWLIPSGALSVSTSPFSISGLAPGTYQVELKHNCTATASNYLRFTKTIQNTCGTPLAPTVIPDVTSASVVLPVVTDVLGYNMEYRTGIAGDWVLVGTNIPASIAYLNPPLAPLSQYQVHIQADCTTGSSAYSLPTTFNTLPVAPCLANKNFGKNLSAAEKARIDHDFNVPSPYPLGTMIAVNDGGLIFRSFQNSTFNQITLLTKECRIFHTMDEDFDNSLGPYAQNIKPKDTNPEGTPANTAHNKGLYHLYRNTHGFSKITGATELLQYGPQSWKDKIYLESDWSVLGAAGIKNAFENYTKKIIDEFAPADGLDSQLLMSHFQVGNELWDYPVKEDYHSLLSGARSAFVSKYGEKSGGGWKMKLVAGAFQAFRDNNCAEFLRDVSNCNVSLQRHDFIGDYLSLADCNVLKDLDAIDCHSYSFLPGTNTWTFPENPLSETWQIRNMAGWRDANRNNATGVLQNTRLWSSEFGFDSDSKGGVGEKTQSAYLLRGLFLHSRYHFEKVFFYNAFDHARTKDPSYSGLYSSSGFWKLGTEPANSAWPSPLEAHGATAKPSWYGMLDLKARLGEHVFYKALVEDAEAYIFLMAKPDGSDPYLVFWSPQQTDDGNINQDITLDKVVNWAGVLSGNYKIEGSLGQTFAESSGPGQMFSSATGVGCGATNITTIRRNPAFIRLVPCDSCPDVISFKRYPHAMSNCNSTGDYYYEVVLQNVTLNDEILITGLPNNGINAFLSSLNGAPFSGSSFLANLQFMSESSLRWLVKTDNGTTQTLRLYYCWANNYPNPVELSTASSLCAGETTPCMAAANVTEPGSHERTEFSPGQSSEAIGFSIQPNPGSEYLTLTYLGVPAAQAHLRIVSATGQLISTSHFLDIAHQQQWRIDASGFPPGHYFVCFQIAGTIRYQIWEKF
jgi:hypothetical protein